MNSTWLITSELANQRARKVLFTCVVYTNQRYLVRVTLNSKADKPVALISGSNWQFGVCTGNLNAKIGDNLNSIFVALECS